jgi:WD40 repeat protein
VNSLNAIKRNIYAGHTGAVYALEAGPEPHLFFSGSGDHMVVEWNMLTHEAGTVVCRMPGIAYSIRFLPLKNMLIVGQSQGAVHFIDFLTKNEIYVLPCHQGPVFDMLVSEEKNMLITAGGDGDVHFISLSDFRLIKTLHFGQQKVRCLTLVPGNNQLLAGCQDGTLSIIDLDGLALEYRLQIHPDKFSLNAAAFINGGNLLLTGSRDACLKVLDAKNKFTEVQSIPAHNYAIYHIVTSPDNKYFATASRDKSVKIWSQEMIQVLLKLDAVHFEGHLNSVNRLLWSESFQSLLSAGDDRSIIEWKIAGDQ